MIEHEEKRFDVGHGCVGCLVASVCIFLFPFALMAIPAKWHDFLSVDVRRGVLVLMWFFAVCLGGHVAARRGRTTGWTNSLVVGVFAEILIAARLLSRFDDQFFSDAFVKIINDPEAYWVPLVGLVFTIPAALVGGLVWQRSYNSRSEDHGDATR